jgi:hypothetical protein
MDLAIRCCEMPLCLKGRCPDRIANAFFDHALIRFTGYVFHNIPQDSIALRGVLDTSAGSKRQVQLATVPRLR